jgi:outer membrane protein OmpA-like peptidoglycan-associated protein
MGAGVRFSGFELNYALVPFGRLGDTHRASLTYRFEPEAPKAAVVAPPQKIGAIDIKPQIADYQTGTLKQAMFDLKPQARTDIKNWSLEITDKQGNVIRTYTGKGVPPKQLAWDGMDSSGHVVSGGVFTNYNFRTVDVRGQEVVATEPVFKASQVPEWEYRLLAAAEQRVFVAPSIPISIQAATIRPDVVKAPGISFGDKSSKLNPAYYNYLDEVARLIQKYPNSRVYIEGHAYEEGAETEAQLLSQSRADAVLSYLVEKGKVSPDNLYSRGHGDTVPLDTSGSEDARFKNRRVDIVILNK